MSELLALTGSDIRRITSTLYVGSVDRVRDLSSYWVLLGLSAVIASAGVVADSTATVIGAMIVAPLMRPILGTACALVLADRRELVRALLLVLGGGLTVVLIGVAVGLLTPLDVVDATNGQVAGRVNPRLIDLLAALATGLVGAFALIRSDVSDTLPGVAIAISLVPPLAVVGLTLESGRPDQALGALLLFGTNVAAIIATGTALLLMARVRAVAVASGQEVGGLRGRTLALVVASLVLVAVPLGVGSWQVARAQLVLNTAKPVAEAWAGDASCTLTEVSMNGQTLVVGAFGTTASPPVDELRRALDRSGLQDVVLELRYNLGKTWQRPAG